MRSRYAFEDGASFLDLDQIEVERLRDRRAPARLHQELQLLEAGEAASMFLENVHSVLVLESWKCDPGG
ncbi:hypothetical protein FRZ44_16550 [Hypericibacter terrae]|uniref:Uncharacterized protein n=1 Tax=Hypericibacter terrae TaxID=2602015 RepID=A0A5J6MFX7_9PROT|nr:hypothetical protein FRZ44_16550 [Hypericibacter terrae]